MRQVTWTLLFHRLVLARVCVGGEVMCICVCGCRETSCLTTSASGCVRVCEGGREGEEVTAEHAIS